LRGGKDSGENLREGRRGPAWRAFPDSSLEENGRRQTALAALRGRGQSTPLDVPEKGDRRRITRKGFLKRKDSFGGERKRPPVLSDDDGGEAVKTERPSGRIKRGKTGCAGEGKKHAGDDTRPWAAVAALKPATSLLRPTGEGGGLGLSRVRSTEKKNKNSGRSLKSEKKSNKGSP